jgi:hypothetical protein|tara:strand:- start:907 stop:1086 length:180 start_codon:yes stop_codon:yes gene_type:complete
MARPCWRLEAGHENGVREMAPDGKCTDTGAKKSFAAAIDDLRQGSLAYVTAILGYVIVK